MHKTKTALLLLAIACSATGVIADDSVATIAGTSKSVSTRVDNGRMLLDAAAAAKAFGWRWKIITPNKFGAFCNDAGCVPLSLTKNASATIDGRLFLDADAIGKALGFRVSKKGNAILLTPATEKAVDDLPAYNAAWGKGRGFRVGQTLPDIPLTNLDGREVRFSSFLGKKYIIYCWASW